MPKKPETTVREVPMGTYAKKRKIPARLFKKMKNRFDNDWELINAEQIEILDRSITILIFKKKGQDVTESKLEIVHEEGLLEDEDGNSTSLADCISEIWSRVW